MRFQDAYERQEQNNAISNRKKKQAYKREEIKTQTGCKKGGHNKYNLRQNSRKNPWPSCIFT